MSYQYFLKLNPVGELEGGYCLLAGKHDNEITFEPKFIWFLIKNLNKLPFKYKFMFEEFYNDVFVKSLEFHFEPKPEELTRLYRDYLVTCS